MSVDLIQRAPWLSGPCPYGVHTSRGGYQDVAHVRLISDAFRRCAQKRAGRLMIISPPRHSKTTTCVEKGIAWYLQVFPDRQVIFGTHTVSFANTWGERVRNLISEYGAVSGARLGSRTSMGDWTTTLGGGMFCVGARRGAGATGRGGHLIVMDDSVANQQEALSATVQESTWQWWQADFSTRRHSPDTSMVVIGTRWAEKDLLGRLIAAQAAGLGTEGYEDWEILYLPAICDGYDWTGKRPHEDPLGREPGQALWPERWPIEFLEEEQARKPWWFAALYQGRPEPLEGGLLKQTWWNYWVPDIPEYAEVDGRMVSAEVALGPVVVGGLEKDSIILPQLARAITSVDANFLADMQDISKGRQRSDVSVQAWALGALESVLAMFILDRELGMFDLDGTAQAVLAMLGRYKAGSAAAVALGLELPPMAALIEAKANGPAVMAKLRKKGVTCIPVTPLEGKVARVVGRGDTELQTFGRATAFADDAMAGKIYLPHPGLVIDGRSYAWVLDLRHKFAQFPRGGRDDTDAASQAWAKLAVEGWETEARAERKKVETDDKLRKIAGLPKNAPLPTTTDELLRARGKAIVDALHKQAEKRINQQNGRRGRAGWR